MSETPKSRKPKFCLVNGDKCECGRNGWAVKFCRLPLSSVRMAEIMSGLRVSVTPSSGNGSAATAHSEKGEG